MTERHNLVDRLDALLPQTQCTRCGYPICRDYARAIAAGEAAINRCPPGGEDGIAAMAALLGISAPPLDPDFGVAAPPTLAVIDEDVCIGCTKCIQACPVDAIVGAGKLMHTVIADECTGCELCVPACPVDCIAMIASADTLLARSAVVERATHARMRFEARNTRLHGTQMPTSATSSASAASLEHDETPAQAAPAPISRNAVLEAIARGRARRRDGAPQ